MTKHIDVLPLHNKKSGQLIGLLLEPVMQKGSSHCISIDVSDVEEFEYREIVIEFSKRSGVVPHTDMLLSKTDTYFMLESLGVPPHATSFENRIDDTVIFEWVVGEISIDDAEKLWDQDKIQLVDEDFYIDPDTADTRVHGTSPEIVIYDEASEIDWSKITTMVDDSTWSPLTSKLLKPELAARIVDEVAKEYEREIKGIWEE